LLALSRLFEIYRNYLSESGGAEAQNPGRMKIYTGEEAQ